MFVCHLASKFEILQIMKQQKNRIYYSLHLSLSIYLEIINKWLIICFKHHTNKWFGFSKLKIMAIIHILLFY